jgi:hypothetical protein
MKRQNQWCGPTAALFTLLLISGLRTNIAAQSAQIAPESQAGHIPPDSQAAQIVPDSQGAPDPQLAVDQDPPGRVAQLNYIDGSVTFQAEGENDWLDAELNRPLVTGDNLWSDQNSRAELHIGSTALRLGAMTGITLLEVGDHVAQIRLVQGSLVVKVRHVDDEDGYEIDTPNVAFAVMQPGDYRINVDADGGRTDVIVWRGRGEVTGGGSSYTVMADQHATFTGSDQLNYDVAQIPGDDGFDTWAQNRDQAEDESDSANYVSPEMTGYQDLDGYGDWSYVAGYGPCWLPRGVGAGWAPYRFGHWAWVGPWGWTWVEEEPWGFAPFHYGRWAFVGTNWVWVPGPAAVRPVYAPALVAWVGAGSRFSFSAGVGWFPLAPGEVFIPNYRVSRAYVNRVNLSNTHVEMTRIATVYHNAPVTEHGTAVNNTTYANRSVAGGVTVVSRDTFVNAQSVARNVVVVPEKELTGARVSASVTVEPVRASILGAGIPASVKPPAAVMSRQVVALRAPAPMPRSFENHEAESGGRFSPGQLVRREPRGTPVIMPSQAAKQTQTEDGFRSLTSSSAGGQVRKEPVVWEEQGDSEPPRKSQPQPQRAQPVTQSNKAQQKPQPAQQQPRPVAKVGTPVQPKTNQPEEKYSTWHQQPSWSSPSSSGSKTQSSGVAKTSSPPPPK